MMIKNDLKKKFRSRSKARGAMIFEFFSPGIPHILKNSGCEFVIFDMEHSGLTLDKFKELAIICRGINLFPLIRVPELKYNYISRCLDLGAYGVMVPMVNNYEEANNIIKFSKYPPIGKRGAGFGFAHNDYKKQNSVNIIKSANDNLLNIIQIENKNGLENVEEIAKVDQLDCIWVGHFDLSNFLNVPGQFNSSLYLNAIHRIINAAKKNKKSLGIMVNSEKELKFYTELGFNIIAFGTEMSILTESLKYLIKL